MSVMKIIIVGGYKFLLTNCANDDILFMFYIYYIPTAFY